MADGRLKDVLRTGLLWLVGAGALLGVADGAAAQDQQPPVAAPATGVSVEHVREGLRRPELYIPPVEFQEPTFRSGVTEKLETPLDVIRRELQEEAISRPWENGPAKPPGVIAQVDVMPAIYSLVAKIKAIRREHAEAEARQMVQQELAEFCAAHECGDTPQLPLDEGVILPR